MADHEPPRPSVQDHVDALRAVEPPELLKGLARDMNGTITECVALPDGTGAATISFPLPKDHWCYWTPPDGSYDAPPMWLRMGSRDRLVVTIAGEDGAAPRSIAYTREQFAALLREAGRYAYRSATMSGKEPDLDPDALLQNLIVGMIGYFTEDGRSSDEWANPPHER